MAYKRQEFLGANRDQMLSIEDAEYIPYVDVNSRAMKIAKEKFIGVKSDALSPDGRYMVTTKNGEQAIDPLTALFNDAIGNDPKVKAMFKAQSYVSRMDGVNNILANGEANSLPEAQALYYQKYSAKIDEQLDSMADELNVSRDYLAERVQEDEVRAEQGLIKPGTKEYAEAVQIREFYQNSLMLQDQLDLAENAKLAVNNRSAMNVLNDAFDTRMGISNMFQSIRRTAEGIAMASQETERKADDYGKMAVNFMYDVKLEQVKLANQKAYAKFKKDNGITDS
jgi:hypothetical protein